MNTDSKGRKRRPEQDAALKAVNEQRKREGYRPTKALRFTLPSHLADKLEAMPKHERDKLLEEALD